MMNLMRLTDSYLVQSEEGFFLIEVLAVILLFAVVGYSFLNSSIGAARVNSLTMHNSIAMQLALADLERYARIDPATLSAANNLSDSLTQGNLIFDRQVSITVNADSTRTIQVTMRGNDPKILGEAIVSNRYALWGSQ